MICSSNEWQKKLSSQIKESSVNKSNDFGRFIIELNGKETGQVKTMIEQKNGRVKKDIACITSIVAELPFSVLPELARLKQVKKIWADSEVKTLS
jgi:Flagellar hook-length control protein